MLILSVLLLYCKWVRSRRKELCFQATFPYWIESCRKIKSLPSATAITRLPFDWFTRGVAVAWAFYFNETLDVLYGMVWDWSLSSQSRNSNFEKVPSKLNIKESLAYSPTLVLTDALAFLLQDVLDAPFFKKGDAFHYGYSSSHSFRCSYVRLDVHGRYTRYSQRIGIGRDYQDLQHHTCLHSIY